MEMEPIERNVEAVEFLPPKKDRDSTDTTFVCICCRLPRHFLDEDGCGICDECLNS